MKRKVIVNDKMQRGYVYWRTEPVGRSFAPGFTPELTPQAMLRLGVFGGRYMTDCRGEFPASWFTHARLCGERHDPRLNYFGVNASQSLAEWRRNGWIRPLRNQRKNSSEIRTAGHGHQIRPALLQRASTSIRSARWNSWSAARAA